MDINLERIDFNMPKNLNSFVLTDIVIETMKKKLIKTGRSTES